MRQQTLLAVAIATISASGMNAAHATPFMPMDARGLAMGNTGVASARRAHAPAYNPSLLSKAEDDDDFAIILPQFGLTVADEDEMIDTAQDINDKIVPALEDIISSNNTDDISDTVDDLTEIALNLEGALASNNVEEIGRLNGELGDELDYLENLLDDLNNTVGDLDTALNSISGSPLSGRTGLSAAIAFPGKKFAAAISLAGNANFSGRMIYSNNDSNLLLAYGDAASGYVDAVQELQSGVSDALNETNSISQAVAFSSLEDDAAALQSYSSDEVQTADGTIRIIDGGELSEEAKDAEMDSQLQVLGLAMAEVGLSISREFDISGQPIAIGITPKLQKATTFHYVTELDNEDSKISKSDFEDATVNSTKINLDVGVSWSLSDSGKWVVGLVGKNLMGGTFETADAEVHGALTSRTVKGQDIKLSPQFRTGLAYNGSWTTIAIDLDLIENDPVAYENATRYASIGAEFDVFSTLQLRAGFRNNLAVSQSNVASVGLGVSPFGLHIDIAALMNLSKPEKEAGVAAELGFYF
ncbi:MAG: conjugal transfer protein TraF [Oceanobacter sp.]